jgi:hypothetical protein
MFEHLGHNYRVKMPEIRQRFRFNIAHVRFDPAASAGFNKDRRDINAYDLMPEGGKGRSVQAVAAPDIQDTPSVPE